MKTTKTNENFASTMNANSTQFEIAEENQAFIIEALSKNIYRDPIGTIIREYCSNAWDANVEAGVKEPIVVNLDEDATGKFFSVVDFGNGLNEEKIKTVFVKYGKSTKSDSDDEIGGFGIGAKSAFAYTDTFFVNTVAEGTMYKYMVSKTNENPEMSLLADFPAQEGAPSGTEIRIYLKKNWDEWDKFKKSIRRQLLHFKDVLWKLNGELVEDFTDRKIYEHQLFDIVPNSNEFFQTAYALVGPVAYPIEYSTIGAESLKLPLAVKFDIGELDVTLSREELRYTEETIAAIQNKLEMVGKAVVIHNKKRSWWCKDFKEFYSKFHLRNKIIFDDLVFDMPDTMKKANKGQRYRVMGVHPDFNHSQEFITFIRPVAMWNGFETKRGDGVTTMNLRYKDLFPDADNRNLCYLLDETNVSTAKMRYISSLHPNKKVLLVKEKKLTYQDYKAMTNPESTSARFKPMKIEKGDFTNRIMTFKKKVERPLIAELPRVSEVEVPKEFLESIRTSFGGGAIKGVEYNDLTRRFGASWRKIRIDDQKVKWDRTTIHDMKDIIFVYWENTDKMDEVELAEKLSKQKIVKFVKSSKKNYYGRMEFKYKQVYLVQTSKKKHLEAISSLSNSYTFEEFKKLAKPTPLMRKLAKSEWFNQNLNTDLAEFLRKKNILRPRKEYNMFSTRDLSYGDEQEHRQQKHIWALAFGTYDIKTQIPQDWFGDVVKLNRYKKTFKEFNILRHESFSNELFYSGYFPVPIEQQLLQEIYIKRGILPNPKNCAQPLFDWEKELIIESESKKEYLQSLV